MGAHERKEKQPRKLELTVSFIASGNFGATKLLSAEEAHYVRFFIVPKIPWGFEKGAKPPFPARAQKFRMWPGTARPLFFTDCSNTDPDSPTDLGPKTLPHSRHKRARQIPALANLLQYKCHYLSY